jgi:hypothetical protein
MPLESKFTLHVELQFVHAVIQCSKAVDMGGVMGRGLI